MCGQRATSQPLQLVNSCGFLSHNLDHCSDSRSVRRFNRVLVIRFTERPNAIMECHGAETYIGKLIMRSEDLAAVKLSLLVFWTMTPCGSINFSPEYGGSLFIRNVGIYLQVHTTIKPRRLTSAKK